LVAPTVIAVTPLRNAPLRLALRNIQGTVQAGGASLSWFAPLQYTDIEIRNEQGELLVALPNVQSDRSLFALLSNLNNLGTFRIERPKINVALRADGSNLEDLFGLSGPKRKNVFAKTEAEQPREAQEGKEPHHQPVLTAEIVDGSINLLDTTTGQKWLI